MNFKIHLYPHGKKKECWEKLCLYPERLPCKLHNYYVIVWLIKPVQVFSLLFNYYNFVILQFLFLIAL